MRSFKDELEKIVGKVLFSIPGDFSEKGFLIRYEPENHIISVSKILEVCDSEMELSVERLLSSCHPLHDIPDVILIGEIRLFDSTHNKLSSLNIRREPGQKHLFGQCLYDNLRMIDGGMPRLLEAVINIVMTTGISRSSEILKILITSNPLHIDNGWEENAYRFKFGRLLYNFVLGMTEETAWNGRVPNGGTIFVEDDICKGFCYFDQTSMINYLIDLTDFIIIGSLCYIKVVKT